MECDNIVKKLFFIFINVIIISLFAALPVSAAENNNFSNAVFTGSEFNWHSGSALSPTSHDGFNHYLIIYSCSPTWGNGDSDYVDFYLVNDSITSINLLIENGACSLVSTSPSSVSPYSAYLRYVSYDFSSTSDSGYIKYWDGETSITQIYRSYDSSQGKRISVFTDLPCYDQNGNQLGNNNDFLTNFSLQYFMDGAGVFHHYVGTSSTISGNNSFNVDWYVIPSHYVTPGGSVSDTFTVQVLSTEYVEQNLTVWQEFKQEFFAFEERTKHVISLGTYEPQFLYYTVPVTSVTSSTSNNTFDINDYSPFLQLKSDILTTHVTQSFCELDMQDYRYKLGLGGIYNYSDISVIAVIHDNTTNKYRILRHDFNVNACLACIDSVKTRNDSSQVSVPAPSNVNDWQSLADYLKNVFDNINYNNAINNANLVNNLTSFPWANVVNAGVGGALSDFLPNLSSEFDSVFTGIFNDFTVPTQDQIDDIQREIQAEQDDLHNKLAFVDDVKTEIYFVSTSIASAGSSEPHFKQKFVYYVPAYNTETNSYYLTLEQTSDEVTFFRGSWIDVNTREIFKDLITVFASLSVLIYIWHTLPSTVGNMPNSGGGDKSC